MAKDDVKKEGWSARELGEQSTLIRQERGQIPTVILRMLVFTTKTAIRFPSQSRASSKASG
jgi:hypothetical protein